MLARHEGHGDARRGGDPRGGKLGDHAAGAHVRAGPTGEGLDLGGQLGDLGDEGGVRVLVGILVVEPVHVREDREPVGIHQLGDQRREGVVVAELQLVDGHRVVLVDDGHHPHVMVQEGPQRVGGVQITLPIGEIRPGQEQLRAGEPQGREEGLVGVHQAALAHGGGCLLGRDGAGLLGHPEARATRPHRPRGDDEGAPAALGQIRHGAGKAHERLAVESVRGCDGAGADLDDEDPLHRLGP
ncbi:hypothetical protein D3C86_1070240 [compost metagenome]